MHLPTFHSRDLTHIFGHTGVLPRLGELDDEDDAVYLSPLALGLAALLLIINGLLSVYLSLGLHKTLGIAAIRQVAWPASAQQRFCLYSIVPTMPSSVADVLSGTLLHLSCVHFGEQISCGMLDDCKYIRALQCPLLLLLALCITSTPCCWPHMFCKRACEHLYLSRCQTLHVLTGGPLPFQVYASAHSPGLHPGSHILI